MRCECEPCQTTCQKYATAPLLDVSARNWMQVFERLLFGVHCPAQHTKRVDVRELGIVASVESCHCIHFGSDVGRRADLRELYLSIALRRNQSKSEWTPSYVTQQTYGRPCQRQPHQSRPTRAFCLPTQERWQASGRDVSLLFHGRTPSLLQSAESSAVCHSACACALCRGVSEVDVAIC